MKNYSKRSCRKNLFETSLSVGVALVWFPDRVLIACLSLLNRDQFSSERAGEGKEPDFPTRPELTILPLSVQILILQLAPSVGNEVVKHPLISYTAERNGRSRAESWITTSNWTTFISSGGSPD